MSMSDGRVVIDTELNDKPFTAGLNSMEGAATTAAGKVQTAINAIKTAAAVVAIGALYKSVGRLVDRASDLVEVQNVVDVTFADSAGAINAWAKQASTAYGLAEVDALRFTGTLGAMAKSSGITGDAIVGMSTDLTGLIGDFASFYNLDHETAFQKIRSGISGETEPLKQLGINMSVANLEAFALSQGITKAYNAMSQAEQVTLRYNYLMGVSADQQGDFARTSDAYANQTRILKLQLQDLGTAIGAKLIPAFNAAVQGLNRFLQYLKDTKFIDRATQAIKAMAPAVAGLVTAWASLKIIKTVSGWVDTAKRAFAQMLVSIYLDTGAVTAATVATTALTAAKAALAAICNPVTLGLAAAATALGALAFSAATAKTELSETDKMLADMTDELARNTEAYEQNKASRESAMEQSLVEIERANMLWQELSNLADANGVIAEADRARAEMLANELNPLLGETIQLNKDGTATLVAEAGAIARLIEQKRVEAVMTALQGNYQEALNAQIKAGAQNRELLAQKTEQLNKVTEAEIEWERAYTAVKKESTQATMEASRVAAIRLQRERETLAGINTALSENEKAYRNWAEDIAEYETAYAEVSTGNAQAVLDRYLALGDAMDDAASSVETATGRMAESTQEMGETVVDALDRTQTDARRKLVNMESDFESAGADMAQGLERGMKEKQQSIVNRAVSLVRAALDAARKTADSHSPSRAFARIGQTFPQGLAVGAEKDTPKAVAASTGAVAKMLAAAKATVAAGQSAAGRNAYTVAQAAAGAHTLKAAIDNTTTVGVNLDGDTVARAVARQNRLYNYQFGGAMP